MAPSTTAASSTIERQRRRKSCRARSALASGSACSIDLVICATRSATRASRVANTLSRVAMPESRKIGVSATWMIWATRSSDESGLSKPCILLPLERGAVADLGIKMDRVFDPPFHRSEIDVHETEPSAVAERPLEIVEQRPHEIAADGHARLDRIEHRPEIAAQIGNPPVVADPAVRIDPVRKGSPVLEDV